MPRTLVAAVAVVLAGPLTVLAQPGSAASSSEPFKVGTFVIGNTQTTGLVLRDSLVVDLVQATREPAAYKLPALASLIEYGASPRATIYLAVCARAHAYLRGRGYVLPDDVKAIGPDVLRHRIITSFEAEAEEVTSEDIVSRIFEAVPVP